MDDARLRFSFAPYAAAGDEYYIDDVVLTSVRPSLQAPALVAPPSGATSQSSDITLRWQQIPGVASYALEVALDSAFGVKVVSDSTIADTLYHLSSLQSGTSYYWHVRAASGADRSPFTSAYMFTTGQRALSAPAFTQLPLQSGFMPVEFTIAWSRVPGATGYQLQLATDSLYQSLDINDSTVTDTVRRIGPLRSGTMYYIRLRALASGRARSILSFDPVHREHCRTFSAISVPVAREDRPTTAYGDDGVAAIRRGHLLSFAALGRFAIQRSRAE